MKVTLTATGFASPPKETAQRDKEGMQITQKRQHSRT